MKTPCLKARLFSIALLASANVYANDSSQSRSQAEENLYLNHFLPLSTEVMNGDGNSLKTYSELRAIYERLSGMERRQAAQLLSMADTLYGRYRDASTHYDEAFPAKKPSHCPADHSRPIEAHAALKSLAGDADFLLINESHSKIETRAFFYEILPILRAAGYRYLAMEAIYTAKNSYGDEGGWGGKPYDEGLSARGFPLDNGRGGVYLREPIASDIVRRAFELGFELVAYDPYDANSKEERESGQALILAALSNNHPEEKIVVLAGYSHVWKTDGWMAERLRAQTTKRVISVDQVSGLGGCLVEQKKFSPPVAIGGAYAFVDSSMNPLSSNPDRTDATVFQRSRNGRGMHSDWLTLGGLRKPIDVGIELCRERLPCLISAHYIKEPATAVPADRAVIFNANEPPVLFLRKGNYRVRFTTISGISVEIPVHVD